MSASAFLKSSLAKKYWMAITGLFLVTFMIVHLGVNLTLFIGEETFNAASEFMATNPLIQVMQYVLAAGFIFHIVLGIVLTRINREARPVGYIKNNTAANSSWSSQSMILTGIIVLLFLVLHLKDYFFQMKFGEVESDYVLVTELFNNPVYTGIYVLAFILLGLHLSHGFQSSFQSVGVYHSRYTPFIKWCGTVFSIIVAIGFSVIALYFYFF